MTIEFDTLQHLGPLVAQQSIAAFCEFGERVWEAYRHFARQHGPITPRSREYLIVRMLYIAEVTSNAIRMTATWELTPAAMSLLRDRYEQTVRFSWLVRNPDQGEYLKYERGMIGAMNSIIRSLPGETVERFASSMGPIPTWATEAPSKEERAQLKAWSAQDLRSMAIKRDAFPPMADTPLARQGLARWYDAIYKQFSSVSHYDRFSIEMAQPHENPDGSVSFSLGRHWPGLLIFQTSLLDMIQCFEATKVGLGQDGTIRFESLFTEWRALSSQLETG